MGSKLVAIAGACALAACGSSALGPGAQDAGTTSDLAPFACMFPSGRACDPVIGCPDTNGCNWCGCDVAGQHHSEPVCDLVGCFTRPLRTCAAHADCPSDETCVYDPGCAVGAMGRCVALAACMFATPPLRPTGPITLCACDGSTKSISMTCGIEEPYRHVGACP